LNCSTQTTTLPPVISNKWEKMLEVIISTNTFEKMNYAFYVDFVSKSLRLKVNTLVSFEGNDAQVEIRVWLKGRVHCFSKQVVINKCFLLNPEKKIGADPSCRLGFRKPLTTCNLLIVQLVIKVA